MSSGVDAQFLGFDPISHLFSLYSRGSQRGIRTAGGSAVVCVHSHERRPVRKCRTIHALFYFRTFCIDQIILLLMYSY
jgi:hypothetical protein